MCSPAHESIINNDTTHLRQVLRADNINRLDQEGYTLLYFACMKHVVAIDTIKELLRIGASVDLKGKDDETPLYIAVFNNRLGVVRCLLSAGANVNEVNGLYQETVLHLASRFECKEIIPCLLSSGAHINARNSKQETPLFVAAKTGRHESVFQLLCAGADASIADEESKTPLFIASEREYKHVVILLKACGNELRQAKAEADLELLRHPKPLTSTDEMIDLARRDKRYNEEVRHHSSIQTHTPQNTPMEVISIKVPHPKFRTCNPLTGEFFGPCRSLEEVGYDKPPPIPKELQNRPPAKLPRMGGTCMMVGTGTIDGGREPIRIDLTGDSPIDYAIPSPDKKK